MIMNIKINHALEANEEENIPTKKAHEENETLGEESNEKPEEKKIFTIISDENKSKEKMECFW